MSIDSDTFPLMPLALSSGSWPTFSIPLEERLAISFDKLRRTDSFSLPIIIRSSEPQEVYRIGSAPTSLLPIFTTVVSMEKPNLTPYPSTSSSLRRIPSQIRRTTLKDTI